MGLAALLLLQGGGSVSRCRNVVETSPPHRRPIGKKSIIHHHKASIPEQLEWVKVTRRQGGWGITLTLK